MLRCDSYDWNGSTYTSSGSYTYNTQTVDGCDSTATLNLTIITVHLLLRMLRLVIVTIGMVQHIRVLDHILIVLKQ